VCFPGLFIARNNPQILNLGSDVRCKLRVCVKLSAYDVCKPSKQQKGISPPLDKNSFSYSRTDGEILFYFILFVNRVCDVFD
jgi:hypothetical protein